GKLCKWHCGTMGLIPRHRGVVHLVLWHRVFRAFGVAPAPTFCPIFLYLMALLHSTEMLVLSSPIFACNWSKLP
ncbi:hypothetical protein PanWU01x14_078860, partial [Parasponia andersonii]